MSLLSLKAAAGQRFRTARSRLRGSAIALTYHRVAELDRDPQLLCVSPARFAEQVRLLSERYTILTAGGLVDLMAHRRRFPDRAVVITLDDGYEDVLTHAKPVLESLGIRATAFVTSAALCGGEELWWDEVDRVVLSPGVLPARLRLGTGAGEFAWDFTGDPVWTDADAEREAGWSIAKAPRSERQRLYLSLCAFMRPLAGEARLAALRSLREQAGVERAVRPTRRTLEAPQLGLLEAGGVIEVGAHTVSHSLLGAHDRDEQHREVDGGKHAVEDAIGHPISAFSYPHGGADAFTALSERVVREAGFAGAYANTFGVTLPWMDRYAIPRCPTEDIDGEEFLARMERWFDVAR